MPLKLKYTSEAIRLARLLSTRAVFDGRIDEDVALLLILEHDKNLTAAIAEEFRSMGAQIAEEMVIIDPEGEAAKAWRERAAAAAQAASGEVAAAGEPASIDALREFARMGFDAPFAPTKTIAIEGLGQR